MTIHEHIKERVELAAIYAEDGAFHSAARVLKDLAADVEKHAVECDRMLVDCFNPYGSGPVPVEPREA